MITKEQQEILDRLKSEFNKINTTELPQGNLLDVATLLSSKTEGDRRLQEIKENNLCFDALVKTVVKDSIKKLAPDLDKLGMKVYAVGYAKSIIRIMAVKDGVCLSKSIDIEVTANFKYEMVGGSSRTIKDSIIFILNGNTRIGAESLEGILENPNFKSQLKDLFNAINF